MRVLDLYRRLEGKPGGKWLFSRLVCFKAPYFSSMTPRIVTLAPDRAVARIAHRRRVTNHLGSVHAIALCNLAEFAAGLACDVGTPAGMRWIPKGMQVEYLKRARGTMTATAMPAFAPRVDAAGYALPYDVSVTDPQGVEVFRARIDMWLSPKPRR